MGTLDVKQPLICIARSARIIAQSLQRAGYNVIALDQFGDLDTRSSCISFYQLADFSIENVKSNLALIREQQGFTHQPAVIYGSGIDSNPQLLDYLGNTFHLIGNPVNVVSAVRTPQIFFQLLKELKVNYPPVQFKRPDCLKNWLAKQQNREGGAGVIPAAQYDNKESSGFPVYYQQCLQGIAFSALFLARQDKIQIVGLHRHFCTRDFNTRPYLMQALISGFRLPDHYFKILTDWIERFVSVTGLTGLNSMDCLFSGGQIFVLEINPRPGASVCLYDESYQEGLLEQHIRSFTGENWDLQIQKQEVSGYWICYADQEMTITEEHSWPDWTADRPKAGTLFTPGDPLCTVTATGYEEQTIFSELKNRSRKIRLMLTD